nr:PREDICTED: alkane hydroxylase MAH1-like [Daucus carota subsp. sativus]
MFFVATFCSLLFIYLHLKNTKKHPSYPTNWPFLGMMPGLISNAHRMHEYVTEVLRESGGTFVLKKHSFSGSDDIITCDPDNIQYILSRNFQNYPKGPKFNQIFELLGEGIFNSDADLWELQRKTTMFLMNHSKFRAFLERISWGEVEERLIPVLDRVADESKEIDLADLLQKFTYDTSCKLILGYDPHCLSIDSVYPKAGEAFDVKAERAFDITETGAFYRHILPISYWKLSRWLHIGLEKKMKIASDELNSLVAHCIALKREELSKRSASDDLVSETQSGDDFDLLTNFMHVYKGVSTPSGNFEKLLKDTVMNLLFAARDTTSATLSWFFWLIATHPSVGLKIREEIKRNMDLTNTEEDNIKLFDTTTIGNLVYLHGALCEAMRLFPAVPLNHKASFQPDVLPSGHSIGKNTRILISFYSVGRMESVWGEDCLEFKPERWISERGKTKHVPSYKFVAFNSGPRTCLGKEMSFVQTKIIAASIIYRYQINMAEGHPPVYPRKSVVLQMKHGLKVKVKKSPA